MNWGNIKKLATSFVHRKDMDWDLLQILALTDINQMLVVQENEGATSLSLTASSLEGFNAGALPPDFARPRAVFFSVDELVATDIQSLLARQREGGFFAISGGNLFAVESGPLSVVYSTRTAPLVSDSDTNALSELYSTVLLYGLLRQAAQLIQDFEALAEHQGSFDQAVGVANATYAFATLTAGAAPRSPYGQVRN